MKPTDIQQFIEDLDGGTFEQKVARALSDIAGAVHNHGREGQVTLTFKVKPLGTGHQVQIDHQIKTAQPTLRGKASEEDLTSTPMYISEKGLTLFPVDPSQDLFPGDHRRQSTEETE